MTIPFDGEDSNGNGYDDRDFNRDGIEDKLIYSFLNTSNLYDIYFYRDISNGLLLMILMLWKVFVLMWDILLLGDLVVV